MRLGISQRNLYIDHFLSVGYHESIHSYPVHRRGVSITCIMELSNTKRDRRDINTEINLRHNTTL